MLRASAHDEKGRRTIILGLEPGNFERLHQGKPILVDATELGVNCDIIIFAGTTPEQMARQLGATIVDQKPEGSA